MPEMSRGMEPGRGDERRKATRDVLLSSTEQRKVKSTGGAGSPERGRETKERSSLENLAALETGNCTLTK